MKYTQLFDILKSHITDMEMLYNTYLVITGGRRAFLVEYVNYIGDNHPPKKEEELKEYHAIIDKLLSSDKYNLLYETETDGSVFKRKILCKNTPANVNIIKKLQDISYDGDHEKLLGKMLGFHCEYRPNVYESKLVIHYKIDDIELITEICPLVQVDQSHITHNLDKMNNKLKYIGKTATVQFNKIMDKRITEELTSDIYFVVSHGQPIFDGMFSLFIVCKDDMVDQLLLVDTLANIVEGVNSKEQLEFVFQRYGQLIVFISELSKNRFIENLKSEFDIDITNSLTFVYNPLNDAFNSILAYISTTLK